MGLAETLIFYLVVGGVVAVAEYVTASSRGRLAVAYRVATAALFWPLFLPVLLSGRAAEKPAETPREEPDAMAAAIANVERELDTALANLDGWAESALDREKGRIAELRGALSAQARRIREMDALLAGVNSANEPSSAAEDPSSDDPKATGDLSHAGTDRAALQRCRKSREAREQNLARLRSVRRQTHADLMATLAWIRELVSMMHLAKFTGAPAARTEALMAQIAAAVEGVSDAGRQRADEEPWPLEESTATGERLTTL